MNSELRARLKHQAAALLERTVVKLELTPLGVALDVDFLEHVSLFVAAVEDALAADERGSDTIPPAEGVCLDCGGHGCVCCLPSFHGAKVTP